MQRNTFKQDKHPLDMSSFVDALQAVGIIVATGFLIFGLLCICAEYPKAFDKPKTEKK